MKAKILLAALGAAALTQVYPQAGVIVDRQDITATVRTCTGFEYTVTGDDWCMGDVCAMVMQRAGGDGIADDVVIDSAYVGTVDMFVTTFMDAMVEKGLLW